jgi:hypothetical protein
MSRGRKPNMDRPIGVEIHIPESVMARVSLLLFDPVRGARKHGAMSALVSQLLREWVEKQCGRLQSGAENAIIARNDDLNTNP